MMELEVLSQRSQKKLATVKVASDSNIGQVKLAIEKELPKFYPDRQSLKAEPLGKMLKDDISVSSLPENKVYFKDLGPQLGWSTVFICEYAGPLFVYLLFYARPSIFYGAANLKGAKTLPVVHLATACWCGHYAKRILETIFVHRFSHATMPIRNLFKNCTYYWGCAAFVSYFINHPLYQGTSYGDMQVYAGLAGFIFNELGNLSIHVALRNLRPEGSKVRKIPFPTGNPFTILFNLVSCPNYTYEAGIWICYSIMTQSLPAGIFTMLGFYQMTVWALGKHRNYKREFPQYPRGRKAIVPFVI
ncbi:very-long-chain enoyl-CoA reductase-like [Convolutriloba macropyga]|uniref:very-long-chain enoyl-CoA reductase-like n=1 Tax=Convolutriloba macropyga TaxID=536237 RepID=UPI003F520309